MKTQNWLRRILIGLLAVLLLGVVAIAGVIGWDALFPAQQVTDFANVSFPGPDGITLSGYLASPTESSTQETPGILLVHEFFGLNESIVQKADLLAGQGYTVLAVDAYRGKTTRLVPRAIFLVVTTPRDQIQADLQAGYSYLASQPQVNPAKIGAVGFCFGGTQVMYLATENPDLRAEVIFYGSGPISDPQNLGVMGQNGPVLGIYGEQDGSIPLSEVQAFEQAMQARGVEHTVTVYPGVGHAFVTVEALQQPGPAMDAWNQMLAFLENSLMD